MHSGVKQARQDEALTITARAVQDAAARLDAIEVKLDRVLALLEQGRPPAPLPPKGGR